MTKKNAIANLLHLQVTLTELRPKLGKELNFPKLHVLIIGLCIILTNIFFDDTLKAQTKKVNESKFETLKPINTGQYYTNSNMKKPRQQKYSQNYSMGGNAQDIIKQQNRQAMQQMGYNSPVVQPSDPYLAHQFILNQYNQTHNKSFQQHQELMNILSEVHSEEQGRCFDSIYFNSSEFSVKTKSYTDALQYLKDQLTGKRKLSVSDAYFVMENAYGNSYLTKKEYDNILNEGVDFMQKWMIQNKYNPNDNETKNMAIQNFLKDTLTITITSPDGILLPQKITHYPFSYDYKDFKGEKDYRNYFTTKCLATGSGQCNSLPATYNSYAEKLGAKSYLSFAPYHSFIKYPDNNGKILSYEPTSSWHISDQWYSDNLFISSKAKASGIYLDTLNRKQIVANCVIDLAFGYLKKYGAADGKFVKECIALAKPYFPKNNNIYVCFVYSSLLARQLDRMLCENKITDLKDINKIPKAIKLHKALMQNEELIKQLGYQDTPEELYKEMMQQQEFKGKKQNNINGKDKRNLFIKLF